MARVTVTDVTNVLPKGTDVEPHQVEIAIETATCITDEIAELGTFSDNCVKAIERYLSAHYVVANDPTLSNTKEPDGCGDGNFEYGFEKGKGICGTRYGQMANTLSKGFLVEYDKQPVSFNSIGSH